MADKIELRITGDNKHLKRELKEGQRAVSRFEKVARAATKRRYNTTRNAALLIQKVRKITAAQTIKTQKIVDKSIVKGVKARSRKEIEITKQLESQKLAETRRANAKDKSLAKQRVQYRWRVMKKRHREEVRRERRHAAKMRRIRRGIFRAGSRLGGVGAIGGLLGGIGLVFKAREILDFDVKLASLSSQAKTTREEQFRLRDSMTDVAIATGVQRDVILDSIRRIVDKSGEYQLAADNVEKLAKVVRGTQVDPGALGETIAALAFAFKDVQWDKKKVPIFDLLEILIAQGDDASVTMQDLAANGEELMGAFKLGGLKTLKDFKSFFALVQVAGGGGTSPEAATMVKNFIIQITKRASEIEKMIGAEGEFKWRGREGVSRLKQKILKPGGGIRDVEGVIKDLLQATGGDVEKILELIPRFRGAMPIALMAREFYERGTTTLFDRVIELGDNAAGIMERRFRRVAETPSQGFERMMAVITKLSDVALLPLLNALSESMISLIDNKDKMDNLVKTFKDLGTALSLVAKSVSTIVDTVNPMLEARQENIDFQKSTIPFYGKEFRFLSAKHQGELLKGGGFLESPEERVRRNIGKLMEKRKEHRQRMKFTTRGMAPGSFQMLQGMRLSITNNFAKGGKELTTTIDAANDPARG